jgi:hypothetical protein
MKAEHRKELETNALAERMGRVVVGMKRAPQKKTMVWLVIAGAVVVIILLFSRYGHMQKVDNALNWEKFSDGQIQQFLKDDLQSNQSKASFYELNFLNLRQWLGHLATEPKEVMAKLEELDKSYGVLANRCKDDKVLLPEALFAQAVIKETLILKDADNWQAARDAYKELATNHKDTAFGKEARKRLEILENKDNRDELLKVYQDLRIQFVRPDRFGPTAPPAFLPDNHPPVPNLPVPGGGDK